MYNHNILYTFMFILMFCLATSAFSQTYQIQLSPYDEELAEQMNYYVQEENLEFVKNAERNEYYLGRLIWESTSRFAFLGPSNRSYDSSDFENEVEEKGPSDIPYQTKKHRMRQLRQDAGLEVDNQGNIIDEGDEDAEKTQLQVNSAERVTDLEDETTSIDTVSEKMKNKEQIDEEEKPGFFSRLFGGSDKKVGKKNPSHDGGRVVIAKPEPRLSGSSVLKELPKSDKVLNEAEMTNENQSEELPSDALVPRKPGAEYDETIVKLNDDDTNNYQDENEKGILDKVVDTITFPFRDSDDNNRNRSYTIISEYAFPTGREMSLPEVKTRNKEEMRHLFAQLAAQTASWLKTGNTEKISALNSSVSVRNVQDLNFKFERAEENPFWDQPTKQNQIDTVKSTTNQ